MLRWVWAGGLGSFWGSRSGIRGLGSSACEREGLEVGVQFRTRDLAGLEPI